MSQSDTNNLYEFISQVGSIGYDVTAKKKWKRLGTLFLQKVRGRLKGHVESSDIGWNPGGIAVSGDHSLYVMFNNGRGACVFFNFDRFCDFVTFRSITSMKDYTGGPNNNHPLSVLEDPSKCAEILMRLGGVDEQPSASL